MGVTMERENPYRVPRNNWERGRVGTDIYQTETHCPYCGTLDRNEIRTYEGAWFRLRCGSCGEDYKVRTRCR